LDNAYTRYREKFAKRAILANGHADVANGHTNGINGVNGQAKPMAKPSLADFDYQVYHSPYGKLVAKSHGRVVSKQRN
jgi:hydroxymethylglutaryl-CoA synthase